MKSRLFISLMLLGNTFLTPLQVSAVTTVDGDRRFVVENKDSNQSEVFKLPQSRNFYTWVNNDWSLNEVINTQWNDSDLPSDEVIINYENTELLDCTHNIYEYDSNGSLIRFTVQSRYDEADPWTNEYMYTYKYDDVDSSFVMQTDCYRWQWMFDDWEYAEGYGSYYEIIRDDANRVLQITQYQSINSTMISESVSFEYKDATGPATKIYVERLNDNYETVPYACYENIKWHKSDCNYLKYRDSMYFMWLEDKNNLMRSANLYTYNEYGDKEYNAHIDVAYDEQDRRIKSSVCCDDGHHVMNAYEYDITPNGDYKYYMFSWTDLDHNKTFERGEEILDRTSECITHEFDSNGNEVLVDCKLYNTKSEVFDKQKYREVYDIEYLDDSTIKQYIYTRYNKYDEVAAKEKYVYDNFKDAVSTSIVDTEDNNIRVGNGYVVVPEDSKYVISDIQGRILKSGVSESSHLSFTDLPSGIYIISVNGKQLKVMR